MPMGIAELLEPIAGANPGGANLRYEPIYEQIKQARIEEEELPAGAWETARKTADYTLVIRLATEALTKRSKDLQIAAWLTEALLKREGFGGLAAGLRLLAPLVDGFWDHLYPELDEDGDTEFRAAPLEWVGQYLDRAIRLVPVDTAGHTIMQYRESRAVGYEADATTYEAKDARKAAIAAGKITAEAFDAGFDATPKAWYKRVVADMDAALEAVDALDLACQARFGSASPRLSPLRDAVAEVRREVEPLLARKLEAEPDPVEEAPAPEAVAAEAELAGGAAPTATMGGSVAAAAGAQAAMTAAAVPKTRADAEARIASAAKFLRAEAPSDPAAFLMLRGFRWGELRAGDGRVDPKLLAAPPTEVRTRLKGWLLDEKWRELLEAGEDVMATPFGRGWLDLQRYCVTACDGLGGEYERVGAAIRGELRSLLRDLPGLLTMTMTDDTPTANPETLGWLRSQGLLGGEAAQPEVVAAPRRLRRDPLEQAQELARAKQPQKAIELLMREAEQERSARSRFLRRSQATAIMVEAGLDGVALPILQQLADQIQRHTLEEWEEGETIAMPLALLYRCLMKLGTGGSTTQDLYLRVCRLDPMQALQLPPNA